MRTLSWLGVLLSASVLGGQDSGAKFDTPEARVIEVTTAPGQRSAMHTHQVNRVMIYLDDGHMTLTDAQGKVEHVRWRAGDVRWSPAAGPHVSENVGSAPYRIVEVELKNAAGGELPENPLDPVLTDPKHYQVEFENPQVRVLRARYGPHETGALHEHILNRVVVLLTNQDMNVTTPDGKADHARAAAGEVRLGGRAKHREENLSSERFEVVAVELKH